MALVLDAGPVVAWYDRQDRWHGQVRELIENESGAIVLPSPVIPEVDYMLGRFMGAAPRAAFYADLVAAAYLVKDVSEIGYRRILELNLQYASLNLGFVDAAVMSLAEELGLGRIATVDRRHFGAVELSVDLVLLP